MAETAAAMIDDLPDESSRVANDRELEGDVEVLEGDRKEVGTVQPAPGLSRGLGGGGEAMGAR